MMEPSEMSIKKAPPEGSGKAQLGDAEFTQLYEAHSRAVYYLALRLLGDSARAEDVTHDVFMKAFRKMDQFRGGASWRTWLYRITINHCLNVRRAWYSRNIFSNADEAIWDNAVAPAESPLRILETKELGQRIQSTLDSLPEEQRLLLLLVADEQMSYEEIASLTEQTTDAVRGKLHRARKAFYQRFHRPLKLTGPRSLPDDFSASFLKPATH